MDFCLFLILGPEEDAAEFSAGTASNGYLPEDSVMRTGGMLGLEGGTGREEEEDDEKEERRVSVQDDEFREPGSGVGSPRAESAHSESLPPESPPPDIAVVTSLSQPSPPPSPPPDVELEHEPSVKSAPSEDTIVDVAPPCADVEPLPHDPESTLPQDSDDKSFPPEDKACTSSHSDIPVHASPPAPVSSPPPDSSLPPHSPPPPDSNPPSPPPPPPPDTNPPSPPPPPDSNPPSPPPDSLPPHTTDADSPNEVTVCVHYS